MRSNSRLKVRASAVRSSSVRLSGMRRLQSPSMRRRAVCRIESIRPRNCALSHSPPIVPSASVAATAQAKAASTPVRIVSERRRSSPTRRDRPVGERRDERTDDLRLGLGRLFAIGLPALRSIHPPAAPDRGSAQVSGDRLAVGADETVGEACAARSARVDDCGEPVASAIGEGALQRVRSPRRSVRRNRSGFHDGPRNRRMRPAPAPRR